MKGKIKLVLVGCIALIAAIYIAISLFYQSHLYANTYINGISVGSMTADAAQQKVQEADSQYSLSIVPRTADGASADVVSVSAKDIDYKFEYDSSASDVLASQNGFTWFKGISGQNDYNIAGPASFDAEKLLTVVSGFDFMKPENMVKAQDAHVGAFDKDLVCYPIIPETKGTVVDTDKLIECLSNALVAHEDSIDLDTTDVYVVADVVSDNSVLLSEQAELNNQIKAEITYTFGDSSVVVNAADFIEWMSTGATAEEFDRDAVVAFLTDVAADYDTYDKEEDFLTIDGYVVRLKHGRFGWHMDIEAEADALIADIVSGNQIEREPAYVTRGQAWGDNDYGTFYIEVNLTGQHVYVVDNGEVLMDTDCVTGCMANGNYTPGGIFGLTYKQTDATLRGADYTSFVKYWMPFNRNIGFHDASWRNRFGGDIYLRSGSHGCVNLPRAAAKELYEYMYTNCPVICYYLDDDTIVSYPEGGEPTPEPSPSPTPTPAPATPTPEVTPEPTEVPAEQGTVSDPNVVVPDSNATVEDPNVAAQEQNTVPDATPEYGVDENNSPEDLLVADPSVSANQEISQ